MRTRRGKTERRENNSLLFRLLVDLGKDPAWQLELFTIQTGQEVNILGVPEQGVLLLANLEGATAELQ